MNETQTRVKNSWVNKLNNKSNISLFFVCRFVFPFRIYVCVVKTVVFKGHVQSVFPINYLEAHNNDLWTFICTKKYKNVATKLQTKKQMRLTM
jgi:hypothetical protein